MKDRAIRRHQEYRAKLRDRKNYSSCLADLPSSEKQELETNIEKYKKVCVMSHHDRHPKKKIGKTIQEKRHDISMKEQLRLK